VSRDLFVREVFNQSPSLVRGLRAALTMALAMALVGETVSKTQAGSAIGLLEHVPRRWALRSAGI
jgi:ABC-type nitrate/sulfonate/bicarbonate transport system permease component